MTPLFSCFFHAADQQLSFAPGQSLPRLLLIADQHVCLYGFIILRWPGGVKNVFRC
jgi:hypothetical protein